MQLQFLSSNSLRCSDLCYGGEFAICRTHKETVELGSFVSFLKTLDGRTAEGCMYVWWSSFLFIIWHDYIHYDVYATDWGLKKQSDDNQNYEEMELFY